MNQEDLVFDFPSFEEIDKACNQDGLLAAGGNLHPQTLLNAYPKGIFPWFNEGEPILWWSPNPRCVLFPNHFKISKSFRNTLNKKKFTVTQNTCFEQVISECSEMRHEKRLATWILPEMKKAYTKLHQLGFAHSIEVWENQNLAGGLYGVKIGKFFFGESMFSKVKDASKIALHHLCQNAKNLGIDLIDCQLPTEHLKSLGAEEMSRKDFFKILKSASSNLG